jgi:hypothetical protein
MHKWRHGQSFSSMGPPDVTDMGRGCFRSPAQSGGMAVEVACLRNILLLLRRHFPSAIPKMTFNHASEA